MAGILAMIFIGPGIRADDVLFIGNSFTFGGDETAVVNHGGIPKLVTAIAESKGKTASTEMVTTGGKDWGFHLQNPATDTALKSHSWNWVVLQDYSTKPTRLGDVDQFMKNGKTFSDRIADESPKAGIILYETWAYDSKNPIYQAAATGNNFTKPDDMIDELHKNYADLQKKLQEMKPDQQVRVAPVGTAFARCIREHPEINLYVADFKHPSQAGCYLSALVIYATIFQESPHGATASFPGFKIDAITAAALQVVADEVVGKVNS